MDGGGAVVRMPLCVPGVGAYGSCTGYYTNLTDVGGVSEMPLCSSGAGLSGSWIGYDTMALGNGGNILTMDGGSGVSGMPPCALGVGTRYETTVSDYEGINLMDGGGGGVSGMQPCALCVGTGHETTASVYGGINLMDGGGNDDGVSGMLFRAPDDGALSSWTELDTTASCAGLMGFLGSSLLTFDDLDTMGLAAAG